MPKFSFNPSKIKLNSQKEKSKRFEHLKEQYGWYTYILKCDIGYYVGITREPEQRLSNHRAGGTISSAKLGNPKHIEMIMLWFMGDYETANNYEKYLQLHMYEIKMFITE